MAKVWLEGRVTEVSEDQIEVEIEEVGRETMPRGNVSIPLRKGDYIEVLFVTHNIVGSRTVERQIIWLQNG